MDKNTFTGVLLMGAVILGFMWLNKPSQEEIERQRVLAEAQARQVAEQPVLTVDSVSNLEKAQIASTIQQLGTLDSLTGNYTLRIPEATLTLSKKGITGGFVSTPAAEVPVADILNASYGNLSKQTAAQAVANLRLALANAVRYKGFAKHLTGTDTTVELKNSDLTIAVSTHGGVISSAILNRYNRYDSTDVNLMNNNVDSYNFTIQTPTQRFLTSEFYFTPTEVSDSSVTMQLNLGDGATWSIRYTLPSQGYIVKMDLLQNGMQAIIPQNTAEIDFSWNQKMARNEAGRVFEERNSALYYMYVNGDVEHLKENSSDAKDIKERIKWIGYKNQFFTALLVADKNFTSANFNSTVLEHDQSYLKQLTTDATLEYSSVNPTPASFTFFFGPNSYPLLNDLQDEIAPGQDLHLTKLIPLGWSLFRWINTLIVIPVFDLLGKYITNYGIIILILTIFIKLILFPFTYKSYMSQARMKVLAPEIKAINDKYPGNENAMKRNQETLALYSRAGANPMSGCLPMLLQMPVLIAMFNFFPSAIELRGEPFLWAKDLSAPDAIISWTANIPLISSTYGNHVSLFCLLMTIVNIIYTKINMQNQTGGNAMPGMKWMMYLMPVMFLVFFNNYAAGLSYYYFLSLLITILQTFIFRRFVNEEKVRATIKQNAAKPKKKSGFMARLEEANRKQQALIREQERQRAKKRK